VWCLYGLPTQVPSLPHFWIRKDNMARVDTHQLIQELVEGGLPQKPSEIIGKAFLNSSNSNENYVTKEQFAHLEKEQVDIKTSLAVITKTMASKEDLDKLKTEVLEVKSEIKTINTNIKWIMAILLLIAGILLKNTFIH
jgi:hypothetical protein